MSSEEQRLDSQRLPVERYVKARGWKVVARFIEEAVSGAAQYRKTVDEILKGARHRDIDAVVIYRGDRSFRSARAKAACSSTNSSPLAAPSSA